MALAYGIDLGNRALKVVAGRKRGSLFELHRAFSIPVEMEGGEAAILAAAGGLEEALGKASGARFGVSGRDLIIRYTQVPQVPLWRLRRLMEFEVREMSEQAGDALDFDYNIINIPGREEAEETVLVALVKEHFLAARHKTLTAACGEPRGGVPSSLALFNAYLHSGELHEDEFVFLVDIGDQNVEFVLEKDGELLFARNIAAGGRQLTEVVASSFGVPLERAEDIKAQYGNVTPKGQANYESSQEEKVANALIGPAGQLASMIQSSLAFSRAQTGVKDLRIGRMLLSGGGANLRGLDAYLESTFSCPVERFIPESGLELGPLDAEEAAEFERDPGRFAVALGLALSDVNDSSFLVDLLPAPVKKKRAFVGRTLFMWMSAAAAVIFLVLTWMDLSAQAGKLQKDALRETRKARKARREREEYERETDRIAEVRTRRAALNRLTLPIYAQLQASRLVQAACPEDVWVEGIHVRSKRPRDVRGGGKGKGEALARVLVRVEGEIVSRNVQAEEALQQIIRSIQDQDPGCKVTIDDTSGGASRQDIKLGFALEMDFFPEPAGEGE